MVSQGENRSGKLYFLLVCTAKKDRKNKKIGTFDEVGIEQNASYET